ncbi:hypothetical protein AB1Y20_004245 [Prymnesium parvum]|uniref:Dynein light chain n=1 Tax=Prymnesium parvum TaxID=97485 RepID=A0AB34J9F4_PRYPA
MAEEVKKPEESTRKIEILKSDMNEEMIAEIIKITAAAFKKHTLHKDVATHVKQSFDAKYPPADNKATSGVYHCIVGSDFAVSATHETHFSCFWRCDNVKLLLYKSKDSPFD